MRAVLSAIILFCFGLGLFGWAGYNAYASTSGAQATAVVDHCNVTYGRKGRKNTTCFGSWSGEASGSGTIEGVGSDDQGKSVTVHVHGDTAYSFSWAGILIPAGIGGFLFLAGLVWLGAGIAGRRKAAHQRQLAAYYPPPQQYAYPQPYPQYPQYPPQHPYYRR